MKAVRRKLGEPIPDRLILLPNGTLAMADGSDPAAYLRSVRRSLWKCRGPVAVVIQPKKHAETLEGEAWLLRNIGA